MKDRLLYKHTHLETNRYFLSIKKPEQKNGWKIELICSYELPNHLYIEMCSVFDTLCLN
jgi:hypothetical protein